ncbi:MAG: DUF4214 domain-containing protein [Acidobacteria bacterium]|nr:DUF4214 domain-containing protein [Acidobacteriota bacterium]
MSRIPRARLVVREIGWLAAYSLLAIGASWPLARLLDRAVNDPGDPLLNAWILHWDWLATFSSRPLFHANIFHPDPWSLAFSENLYGIAIFTFPLRFAGASPLTAYNVAMIAGIALSGYGAHVLARTLLSDLVTGWWVELVSLVAGIYFALLPYRFEHFAHLQHVWAVWLPLSFAALVSLMRRPGRMAALVFIVAYVFNGLSNIHWLLFAAVTIPLLALVVLALEGEVGNIRTWGFFATAFVIANLLLVPILVPYRIASEEYGMVRDSGEASFYSATVADWTVGAESSRTWGKLGREIRRSERTLFPGAFVLLLTGVALLGRSGSVRKAEVRKDGESAASSLVRRLDLALLIAAVGVIAGLLHTSDSFSRVAGLLDSIPLLAFICIAIVRLWFRYPRWMADRGSLGETIARADRNDVIWIGLALVVIGFFGSLGLNAAFHTALFTALEPFRSLRVPARWAMIAYCGLSVLAAAGFGVLLRWTKGWRRILIAVTVPLLMLAELWSAPIHWWVVSTERAAVYEWLRDAPVSGGTLELPIGGDHEYRYVFASTIHNKPIMNGTSGFMTPLHDELRDVFGADPVRPGAMAKLESNDASLVIVHNDRRDAPPAIRSWLEDQLAGGRLRYLRRFPHVSGHDYVFAVVSNEPRAGEMAALDGVDPAGRSERENLEVFLDRNGITWIDATFGHLYRPREQGEVHGRLTVEGWALSPRGISSVDLLFQNEAVRLPARLEPDPMVAVAHPDYGFEKPRFVALFEDRPKGIRLNTDLIVEIVDGKGERSRLRQRFFRWHRLGAGAVMEVFEWDVAALEGLLARMGYPPAIAEEVIADERTIEDLAIARLEGLEEQSDRELVETLYRVLLLREPDPPGLQLYEERLRAGASREVILRTMLASEEFRTRYSE